MKKKYNQYLTLYKARDQTAEQNETKFFMKLHLDFWQDDKCHIEAIIKIEKIHFEESLNL